MASKTSLFASPARALFRRCVQCPDTNPSCPSCGPDETCSLQVKTCDTCAFTTCVKSAKPAAAESAAAAPTPAPNGPSSVGPIVGGVLGGILAIILATFLVWWFCIRRRKQQEAKEWEAAGLDPAEKRGSHLTGMERYSTAGRAAQRASTHTVASVASTVLTRASNIIQIAYIPGVTNRSAHSSPDLVPPVPPIPAISPLGSSTAGSPYHSGAHGGEEQHYFLPDMRASQYSARTDRSSLARGSIVSQVYRDHAVVNPLPALAAQRVQPTAISLRSTAKNSPSASRAASPPPALPASRAGAYHPHNLSPQPSHPLLQSKSSMVGRVGTPKQVTLTRKSSKASGGLRGEGAGPAVAPPAELEAPRELYAPSPFAESTRRASPATVSSVSPPPPAARRPGRHHHSMQTSLLDEPLSSSDDDSPTFEDAASGRAGSASTGSGRSRASAPREAAIREDGGDASQRSSVLSSLAASSGREAREERRESLNAIIQEATRRATQLPRHGGLGFRGARVEEEDEARGHDPSPFSDEHAAHTP